MSCDLSTKSTQVGRKTVKSGIKCTVDGAGVGERQTDCEFADTIEAESNVAYQDKTYHVQDGCPAFAQSYSGPILWTVDGIGGYDS